MGGEDVTVAEDNAWAAGGIAETSGGLGVDTRSVTIDTDLDFDVTSLNISMAAQLNQDLSATNTFDIQAAITNVAGGITNIDGNPIRFNSGSKPASGLNDIVVTPDTVNGTITSGSPSVLLP